MMSRPTVLITGFEPFAGATRNPSGEIATALDGQVIAGATIRGVVLPTAYAASERALAAAIKGVQPDIVLALGVFEGRRTITPERVAINLDAAPVADNAGDLRPDQPIRPAGPAAFFSRLPVRAMAEAITAAGLPAGISLSAGTFVCNHLFYELMGMTAGTPIRAGFVHVPALPGMGLAEMPSLPLPEMIHGIRAALEAILAA
jgi:pyroglutamyl-peptidase